MGEDRIVNDCDIELQDFASRDVGKEYRASRYLTEVVPLMRRMASITVVAMRCKANGVEALLRARYWLNLEETRWV